MGNQRRKAEAERRRAQRRRNLMVGVVALIVMAVVAAYFLFIRKTVPPVEASSNAAEAFAGGTTGLLYANFENASELHLLDLESEDDEVVAELPHAGNTSAAPGSSWLTIQVAEEREGDKVQPVLYLFDAETEEESVLGTGYDPTWSADGSLLAWNRPVEIDRCGEEECKGPHEIAVTDVTTGDTRTLVEAGEYRVVDWAGDYVIIQDDTTPGSPILQSVSPTGELRAMPIRPIDYWGASPDGRWVVQSGVNPTKFFPMDDGEVKGEGETIAIREGTKLGAGAWAHDSSYVAAFTATEDNSLDFITFRPNAPEPVVLDEGGEASTGAVFWSPENDAVMFQRFTGDELEAVYCPLEEECRTVFTWTSGRSLLRIE